jgi:amidase
VSEIKSPPVTLDFSPFKKALDTLDASRIAELDALTRDADIKTLRRCLEAGQLTAAELTLFYLSRIRQYDQFLRSIIEINPAALLEAAHCDAQGNRQQSAGKLFGIPILLKDNIAAGRQMHNTAGAAALRDHKPPRDAHLVNLLRAEGAVILGKTNLSEWAFFMSSSAPSGYSVLGGQVVNPYHRELEVAGSSSGSAVATAARLAAAAVGTETSGSIIAPAAFNGVAGMRPTRGLVSGDLIIPTTRALDCAGPIARHVSDLAELLNVMSTPDNNPIPFAQADGNKYLNYAARLNSQSLEGLRIGIVIVADSDPGDAATELLQAAITMAEASGATTIPVSIPDENCQAMAQTRIDLLTGNRQLLLAGSMAADVAAYLTKANAPIKSLADIITFNEADCGRYSPFGQDYLIQAQESQMTARAHQALSSKLQQVARSILKAAKERHDLNILLTLDNSFSLFYAVANTPAVTVPIGLDSNGQPHGATFVGIDPFSDATVLAIAHAFEQATCLGLHPEPTA